jgi:hypothetical protein
MEEKAVEKVFEALQPVVDYASAGAKSFCSGACRIALTFKNNHWTKRPLTLVECWPENGKFVK